LIMKDTNIPDCLFPTDNDLEIPTLRIDMQAQFCGIPFVCFGEQKRTFQMNGQGTLHFYTDDYRFNAVYDHPERILHHEPMNIVEPNFSLFNETPLAFGMQAIYKKRQIARSMQEKGIRVFVDLNVANKWYKLNLLGVPSGWSSFCTRGYEDRLDYLEFEYMMARQIAGNNPLLFVVYGGGDKVRQFCKQHRLTYVNPIVSIKNKAKSNAKKLIEQNTMFFGEDVTLERLLPVSFDQLKLNQIEDYAHDNTTSLLKMKQVEMLEM